MRKNAVVNFLRHRVDTRIATLLMIATITACGSPRSNPDATIDNDAGGTDAVDIDASTVGTEFYGPTAAAGGIVNPYHATTLWKLWARDATPVNYNGVDFSTPAPATRLFPGATIGYPDPALPLVDTSPGTAGFWDDAYATRDDGHSGMPQFYYGDRYGNRISLPGQYIRIGPGVAQRNDVLRLGLNFTSESLSFSGHQLISSNYQVQDTESNFTFANTVRASPAYLSYAETIADRAIDSYDSLYAHAFNSIGRSSSEVTGIFKMLMAGGSMPRATKDLLKKHGAYAITLINLFRSTMPYSNANGSQVVWSSEMLQRPAYNSVGDYNDSEFSPFNTAYHQYNEPLHLFRMMQAARAMTVAPPVAIIKIVAITVDKAGSTIVDGAATDRRIRSSNKTMARIWGEPGETITLTIDVGGSYDLQALQMIPHWSKVYPEQRNIMITHDVGTLWKISVAHDPLLPKGRIPIALTVNNGTLNSSPAFVNFYWPELGQSEIPDYVSAGNPISINEVNKNLRPILTNSVTSEWINVSPGETAMFDLTCTDPEGFPTRYYRWTDEAGTLTGGRFSLPTTVSDAGKVFPVHIICSDGTGGYSSVSLRVVVTDGDSAMPSPWITTVFGNPEMAGHVTEAGGVFELVGTGVDFYNLDHGRRVFQTVTGDVDFTGQILSLSLDGSTTPNPTRGGVMLREGTGQGARGAFVFAQGNGNSPAPLSAGAYVRSYLDDASTRNFRDPAIMTQPNYVKVVRRGSAVAGLVSADNITWELLWGQTMATPAPTVEVGFAVGNSDGQRGDTVLYGHGKFKVVPSSSVRVPIATLIGNLDEPETKKFKRLLKVTLHAASSAHEIRYSVDGSTPTAASTLYTGQFDVATAGPVVVKARAFFNGDSSGVMLLPVTIVP
jgi:hypothetical protein